MCNVRASKGVNFGPFWGTFWAPLGRPFWDRFETVLGSIWAPPRSHFGTVLGPFGAPLGLLFRFLEALEAVLGPPRPHVKCPDPPGTYLDTILDSNCTILVRIWDPKSTILVRIWSPFYVTFSYILSFNNQWQMILSWWTTIETSLKHNHIFQRRIAENRWESIRIIENHGNSKKTHEITLKMNNS